MDKFGKLFEEVNKNAPKGMQIEVARQTKNGSMVSAKPQELATLSTKSRIASTAQLLQKLSKEEKLQWALETKDEANQLYKEKRFAEAMERYVEALTATNFGSKAAEASKTQSSHSETPLEGDSESGQMDDGTNDVPTTSPTQLSAHDKNQDDNVEELVVPVLCNLTACCLELQQWAKVVLFAEQIFQLRPLCRKALYRQGVALLNLNEYSLAIQSLEKALQCLPAESEQKESMPLNDTERHKVIYHLTKAKECRKKELVALDKRKSALQKAFGGSKPAAMSMMSVERRRNDDGEEVLILNPTNEMPPTTPTTSSPKELSSADSDMSLPMVFVVMIRYYLEQLLFLLFWICGITHLIPKNSKLFISKPPTFSTSSNESSSSNHEDGSKEETLVRPFSVPEASDKAADQSDSVTQEVVD